MPPLKRPVPVAEGVNFGDPDIYSGGDFLLPEGDYALFFDVRHHSYTKGDGSRGVPMLGVMATCYPLAGGEASEQFLGLGKKAMASFAPDETGKKLLPIPGAPASSGPPGLTNFKVFLDSLYDCGLPRGLFTNDISVIDGIWVHTQNIPEPETRKALGNVTGEVDAQANKGPRFTLVVTEIKEDGKPWENGGGMPEGAAEAAPAPAPKPAVGRVAPGVARPTAVAPKPAVKPAVVAKPGLAKKAAPAPVVEEAGDEELREAAVACVTDVLSEDANANGMLRIGLRTQTFAAAQSKYDEATSQAIVDTFLNNEASMNALIGPLGYIIRGPRVVVA